MRKISINSVLTKPELLEYDNWGFYDWFCHDDSLKHRMETFLPKLKFLVRDVEIINGNFTYVWFKNNCPIDGSLYDDMRFSILPGLEYEGQSDYLGGICPKNGHKGEDLKCQIWDFGNSGEEFNKHNFKNWAQCRQELNRNRGDNELANKLREAFKV